MGEKLEKNAWPAGHGPDDFECFGPPALQDGNFDDARIADLGCFLQDGKDTNKYYHAAVVKSKKNSAYYSYFEWGRTGAGKPSFQFVKCHDESDAHDEFSSQLHSKNDKRGQWVTVAGRTVLQAKKDKDCYLVRPMATRSTGLPDARKIKSNDGADMSKVKTVGSVTVSKKKKKSSSKVDSNTLALMRDLNVATVEYTRGAMADKSLPTQGAIDETREFLTEAEKRLVKVGDDLDAQIKDKELQHLTSLVYGRIPKIKKVGAPAAEWVLSKDNIFSWRQDLDAFESALYAQSDQDEIASDPFGGMSIDMSWVDPAGSLGSWVKSFATRASKNKHSYINNMTVHNIWKVDRHGDRKEILDCMREVSKKNKGVRYGEKPLFQPKLRPDYEGEEAEAYEGSNSALLFHGTRSVNVSGILRKALMMPKQLVGVVITGAMFGGGLYFADDWKKSAGYTSINSSYWSRGAGSVARRKAFMFLCDVVCGNPHLADGPHGYTQPPHGRDCVFGKGGYSQVQNNEWIVFKTRQHKLSYLIEFDA